MATLRRALHDNPEVCKYILNRPTVEATSIKIGESKLASLGSGLLADSLILQGRRIFKSKPFVACVDSRVKTICHYCLKDSEKVSLDDAPAADTCLLCCQGCHQARFCSKTCQTKAWKLFHKEECKIIRDSPKLLTPHLALYRILFWQKKKFISTEVATFLSLLEDHFDEYSDTEAGDVLFELASSIRHTANRNVALNVILRLLPAIQINAVKMRQPEKSGSFGVALDFISCAINHSCDPNAFLFVEDGHIICRSLREIRPDEEITISYSDPMLPIQSRREYLKAEYFFSCFCHRCESDKVELKAIVRSRTDKLGSLQTIHKVQKMLVQLMNNTVAATNEPGKHKQFEDVKKMERDITALTREAIKDGDWPDHLDPIPLVRSTLARLYLNKREHLAALRNAMRGTLLCRYRNGPEWINNLCTLVQCLAAIAARNPDDTYFTSGGGFPTLKETQCAVRGYGMRLCKDAGAVFGGASQYTVFLCDWFSWVVKTAEPPGPGTAEFEDKFWEAQKKLLAWADVDIAYRVDLSSQLPCAENLANMFGKLSVEGGNETPEAVSDNKAGVDNEAEGDNKDAASGGSGDHKVSHWAGPSYYQGW